MGNGLVAGLPDRSAAGPATTATESKESWSEAEVTRG